MQLIVAILLQSKLQSQIAGNDHFKIKKASGHKTDIAFQRYNLVTEEEMLGMKWLDLNKDEHRTMDTYMDT